MRADGDGSDPTAEHAAWGGWRRLGYFWALVLAILAGLGTTVQLLGPPERQTQQAAPQAAATPTSVPVTQEPPAAEPGSEASTPFRERAPGSIGGYLPRIAADGRLPMQAFATPFDRRLRGPRVSVIIAGIGMNEADSLSAARTLRSGFGFAISPYAGDPDRMATEIRSAGHEVLLSIPMEPTEYPLSDPGPRALMTNLSPEDNLERLHWVMTRASGYVGMTNVLGAMRGDRLSGMSDQMTVMLRELGRRGLMFVDVRADAGRNQLTWHRSVDLVLDDTPTNDSIDQRLELLSRLARDRGAALGLATLPRPVTIERIVAWTSGLADKGVTLVPLTVIAQPPAMQEDAK